MHALINISRIFYQYTPARLSTCPFTIHALLHIADGIKATGPVWCYWAFAMERFCGAIGQHVKNRRNPYASLDRRARDIAQLQLVKLKYGLMGELSPKRSNIDVQSGGLTFEDGPCTCLPDFLCDPPEKMNYRLRIYPTAS